MPTALLIIDMQQALCSGEEAAVGIDCVLDRVNVLSRRAREARVPVILIQHEEAEGPLVVGGLGWQLADELETENTDLRVRKKSPNAFHETDLDELLRSRGTDRLIICGLQTEFCVDTTVRQALALGYEVALAADAHSTVNGVISAADAIAHHNRTLGFMGGFGRKIEVKSAADILGSVRKVGTGRIAAMIGWRPTWQGATNSQMRAGS
ncbi:cysteine hydrolase family protein [Pseudomonas benzenivorans]|uniref:cysteine hydrolase family protein n=1 Tax=Pseudomonas benzenivorans TaxID=556533 RepID=UPI00351265C0